MPDFGSEQLSARRPPSAGGGRPRLRILCIKHWTLETSYAVSRKHGAPWAKPRGRFLAPRDESQRSWPQSPKLHQAHPRLGRIGPLSVESGPNMIENGTQILPNIGQAKHSRNHASSFETSQTLVETTGGLLQTSPPSRRSVESRPSLLQPRPAVGPTNTRKKPEGARRQRHRNIQRPWARSMPEREPRPIGPLFVENWPNLAEAGPNSAKIGPKAVEGKLDRNRAKRQKLNRIRPKFRRCRPSSAKYNPESAKVGQFESQYRPNVRQSWADLGRD